MPKGLTPLLLLTVLTFSTLYAPQPILPLLAAEFDLSQSQTSLLITLVLLPLSLAPVLYGFVLEALSARTLLRGTVLLLAASQAAFALSTEFFWLCAARLAQGLLLPAILTALMTYCAKASSSRELRKTMSAYIAATIFGGFLGRAVTGLVAHWGEWRYAFVLWIVGLAGTWFLLGQLPSDTKASMHRLNPRVVVELLRHPELRRAYLIVFAIFFVFASVLNVVPFEMKAVDSTVSEATIALAYLGYLTGIGVALGSGRIVDILGSEARAIRSGLMLYGAGLALFAVSSIPAMYTAMVIFCAGMFTVHSIASGYVNHVAPRHKGIVNGLYVSLYYGGGTLGSYLPVAVYRACGWSVYLLTLAVLLVAAVLLTLGMRDSSASRG